jgi:hypothetical protein
MTDGMTDRHRSTEQVDATTRIEDDSAPVAPRGEASRGDRWLTRPVTMAVMTILASIIHYFPPVSSMKSLITAATPTVGV